MKKEEIKYLNTKSGIIKFPKKKRILSMFCQHKDIVTGSCCSKSGLERISGTDTYVVCRKSGTVFIENHSVY